MDTGRKMSDSATALHDSLQDHTARDVPIEKTNGIFHVNPRDSPMDGASVLINNHILGAAVYDDEKQEYSGYFDMRDLLSSVMFTLRAQAFRHRHPQVTNFFEPGLSLRYVAQRNPLLCISPDTPLQTVCECLCSSFCRRVAVCEYSSRRCVNIITRRSLLTFISKNVNPYRLDEVLAEAGLNYRKKVIRVREDTTALETFELMDTKNLYGIAIVDKYDGSLKGYTCASDIRLAVADGGKASMHMDIMTYLATVRKFDHNHERTRKYPACPVNATIAEVVSKLVMTRYHRIFVLDQGRVPIGVISLLDVLRFITQDWDRKSIPKSLVG